MAELVPPNTPLVASDLIFSCVSCKDRVEELQCLPCLHSVSVCEKIECRKKLMRTKVSCSECKEVFEVPFDGFPCHLLAKRRGISKAREKEGTFCCADHDSPQIAVGYCSTCPGPLCEECRNAHQTTTILKRHLVTSLDEALRKGFIDKEEAPLCKSHIEPMKYYCQDCEDMICIACQVVGSHRSHKILFFDKEIEETTKQPLILCIKSANERIQELATLVENLDDRLLKIYQEGSCSKEDIAKLKDHMIKTVTDRCALLVAKVDEVEYKRRNDLEEHKRALEHQINQLEQFKTSTEELVHDGTTREQLSLHKLIAQRISSLASTPLPPSPLSSLSVHFVPENRADIEVAFTMGRVSFGPHSPHCTMEGLTISNGSVKYRAWSKPLSFKVVTRDHSDSQCMIGGEKVRAVLTPTASGVQAPVLGQVEDEGDGTYRVEFKCVPFNHSELVVTVNGDHIKGSPVEVVIDYPNTIKQEIRDPKKKRQFRALSFTRSGLLLATDNKNKEVCTFDGQGGLLHTFKVKDAGKFIDGIVELSDGNMAVSRYDRKHIAIHTQNGEFVRELGSNRFDGPTGLAVNNKAHLFVAEYKGDRVSVYGEDGGFKYSFGSEGSQPGEFNSPEQICIAQDGLVYVSDRENNRVQVFQQNGHLVRQFGNKVLEYPSGLAITPDGHIVVVSSNTHKLSIFTTGGECVHEVKDVGLKFPYGLAIDDNSFIFVADYGKHRIVKL